MKTLPVVSSRAHSSSSYQVLHRKRWKKLINVHFWRDVLTPRSCQCTVGRDTTKIHVAPARFLLVCISPHTCRTRVQQTSPAFCSVITYVPEVRGNDLVPMADRYQQQGSSLLSLSQYLVVLCRVERGSKLGTHVSHNVHD